MTAETLDLTRPKVTQTSKQNNKDLKNNVFFSCTYGKRASESSVNI